MIALNIKEKITAFLLLKSNALYKYKNTTEGRNTYTQWIERSITIITSNCPRKK
jgi:hypothetical protein